MTTLTGWDRETSPLHRGEVELQKRVGMAERLDVVTRHVFRPYLPQEHRDFYAQLPFLVVGSVDGDGFPWASLMFGEPGFVSSPNDKQLVVRSAPFAG